ncbi:MAG: transcriptional repressor NrdR [Parasphingorhabdus sp.]|jgi:transcriptional repressor NrdR
MHCPYCNSDNNRVIDSRIGDDGASVRRRRSCQDCDERFTTFERAEVNLPRVIKNDGTRVIFDEQKLRLGLTRALEKRPIASEFVDQSLSRILKKCAYSGDREITSKAIGELVMSELREMDHVAYVRFASVYRRFKDLDEFSEELNRLRSAPEAATGTQLSFLDAGRRRRKGK